MVQILLFVLQTDALTAMKAALENPNDWAHRLRDSVFSSLLFPYRLQEGFGEKSDLQDISLAPDVFNFLAYC